MQISIMQIEDGATVELLDVDNFREFAVFVSKDLDADALGEAMAEIGDLEGGEHVYVEPEKLFRLAGAKAQEAEWREMFDAMVEFASSQGWVSPDGAVRAHIERL